MQLEFHSINFEREKAADYWCHTCIYSRKIKRRCFIRLTNLRVLVASTVSVLRNDRLRSFRVITHASLPFCWSHQSFIPFCSRYSWSCRSCRMSALHGAGSDPTTTIWETWWRLVSRSSAPRSAYWYTSVCRISRQTARSDLPRAGAGNVALFFFFFFAVNLERSERFENFTKPHRDFNRSLSRLHYSPREVLFARQY